MATNLETRLEREGNVCHIYKPEGTYTVVYGVHIWQTPPEQIPKTDGLFLELVSKNADQLNRLMFCQKSIPYEKVIEHAEQNRIPIYFPDVGFSHPELRRVLSRFSDTFYAGVGGIFALASYAAYHSGAYTTSLCAAMAGGMFLFPYIVDLAGLASILTGRAVEEDIVLQKSSRRLFPWRDILIKFSRDALIAYKQEWLMNQQGPSHYTTIIGRGHVGIEDMLLQSLEDTLKVLREIKPLIRWMLVPETVYKIPMVNYTGNEWQHTQTYEVPELKELVTK
ncbi:hypothetical protein HY639_01345 [Candidatus Woesearchaeota archaeon]|nr:hypothetical protein [Candidatus Woesearchaeota archaeon]